MLEVYGLKCEYMSEPLGIEDGNICFSWKLRSDVRGTLQVSCTIELKTAYGEPVWSSGKLSGNTLSFSIHAPLEPCSQYAWRLSVIDNHGNSANGESRFETGFMNGSQTAWAGAEWIGASRPSLFASTLPVFALEAEFSLKNGTGAFGLSFGGGDVRLRDRRMNEMRVEGGGCFRYEVDMDGATPFLRILREGYSSNDTEAKALATVALNISSANRQDTHRLRIELLNGCATTYLDGVIADQVQIELPEIGEGMELEDMPQPEGFTGRTLNPLGSSNCPLYPMLGRLGLYARGECRLHGFRVRNLRWPGAMLFDLKRDGDGEVPVGEVLEPDREYAFDPSHGSAPLLRKRFTLTAVPRRARLYIACRGIYSARLNGKRLDDSFFSNGAAQYDQHLPYRIYDVTPWLHAGENALSLQLASGWYTKAQGFGAENYNYWGDMESALVLLKSWGEDGLEQRVVSDSSWKCCACGPVLDASFFQGECYDAIRAEELGDVSLPVFNDSDWERARRIDPVVYPDSFPTSAWPTPRAQTPELRCFPDSVVRQWRELEAVSVREVARGIYVFDMGQNLVGVPKLHIRGKRGETALLRYAEVLYPETGEDEDYAGQLMTENLREAMSIDRYTFSGTPDGEDFTPEFTFHGYRYVEISGVSTQPRLQDVRAAALSSLDAPTGELKTSNALVNRLFENIRWSQYGNSLSIPTDCPQRNERMGWAGDAQVFVSTALMNANSLGFYRRYLLWMRDCQRENGQYPCIAPIGGGFGGIAWESAGIIITHELWRHSGNIELVRENYAAMQAYIRYLYSKGRPGDLSGVGPLGDWLAADYATDSGLLWNAIAVHDLDLMVELSGALGLEKERAKYERLYKEAKALWNEIHVEPQTGRARGRGGQLSHTQCSYALPLAFGLPTEENRCSFKRWLRELTRERGYTVTTGFLGTGLLNPTLTAVGDTAAAYKTLTQTAYPSWLYSVTQGATTIWERWNSYTQENGFGGNNVMNSFNHYSLGAVGKWMYASILGIDHSEAPGWQSFQLAPAFYYFESAGGFYDSPCGRIISSWQTAENGDIVWDFAIPAGCTAQITLPDTLRLASRCAFIDWRENGGMTGSGDYTLVLTHIKK